ncbi:hypothetical protein EYF80_012726 [Liparis tanakae]|uniref:Uncharacterized protein n=1 Tax=Liparis tanakae TaxID=230148 RepID=A0A4Z2IGW2_9TELE|nr:hypothetical protein EYF80_012726 [Liparis tanakae]
MLSLLSDQLHGIRKSALQGQEHNQKLEGGTVTVKVGVRRDHRHYTATQRNSARDKSSYLHVHQNLRSHRKSRRNTISLLPSQVSVQHTPAARPQESHMAEMPDPPTLRRYNGTVQL